MARAADPYRTGGKTVRNPILDALFIRATVVSVAPAGRFRKVRLSAPKLAGVDWTPGQQVRIDWEEQE